MDQTQNDNGRADGRAYMSLIFDAATFALTIDFKGPNLDCALAMLQQAERTFEAQLRAAHAVQLRQQMAEQEQNARIAAQVRGKR